MVDATPEEPKNLLEEKLKKVTTERAPVAGQQPRGGAGGGRSGGDARRSILDGLVDRGSTGNPMVDQLLRGAGGRGSPFGNLMDPTTPGADLMGSGAAAAAGVLTAVDEDQEGDPEAECPAEFEYFSDGPSDEEDDE